MDKDRDLKKALKWIVISFGGAAVVVFVLRRIFKKKLDTVVPPNWWSR